jgi:4-amino-4-deoxy-L-arabinose transferase-like glycosyltransferase
MSTLKKIWWISLLVKLLLSALIPLSADEAYYWVWSQFPQLSYYDHPAMAAWLFKLGSFLPGAFIRWPAVILFHLSFLLWFKFLKTILNSRQLEFWFALCLFCPLTGFGSVILTPDIPLFVFFSLSLYFFVRALEKDTLKDYIFFGVALGFGFVSKYSIVIAAVLMLSYLIVEKKWEHLKAKKLSLVVLFGLIFSMPVIIWNYQNGFKSFAFQLEHGLGKTDWKWSWTTDYLLGMLFILFPLNLYRATQSKSLRFNNLFKILAFGGLGFFLFTSFRRPVELNWPMIFIPCLYILAVSTFQKSDFRKNIIYWSLIYVTIFILGSTNTFPPIREKLNEPYRAQGWKELPQRYSPLYASTYQLSSLMWWTSQSQVLKLPGSSRYDFFDEIQPAQLDLNSFYLLKEKDNNLPDWVTPQNWDVQEVQKLDEKHLVLKVTRRITK